MAEFQPCPFCGNEDIRFVPDEELQIEDAEPGLIWCPVCNFSSDVYASEEIAARKWNRRPDSNVPTADVAPVPMMGETAYCPDCGAKMDLEE